jgi:hypothetical protein
MRSIRVLALIAFLLMALLLSAPFVAVAVDGPEAPPTATAAQLAEIDRLLTELDAADCDTRDAAARRLAELAADPACQGGLAERADAGLLSVATSYELRLRLKTLRALIPANAQPDSEVVTAAEVDQLLTQLDDDSPAIRAGAAERLAWFAKQPTSNGTVLYRLTAVVDVPTEVPGLSRQREQLWKMAHSVWLASDPASWKLPAVTDEEIETWAATLAIAGTPNTLAEAARFAAARRQLVDLLARDDYVPRVRQALAKHLTAENLDVDAAERLREVDDWTRPALVAEYWQGPEHLGIQHLLIGVANQSEGAERPSLFDRSDDATAHCVSGNSLSPGDYPVGVFFPHPRDSGAQFHLVNLPTARQRLAYDSYVARPTPERLAEVTQRTLDWMIARGQPLSLGELAMLEGLDPEAISRFAGKYFLKVPDSNYDEGMQSQLVGQLSRHHNLCCLLARFGTPAAVPGIVEAIEAGRFLPPRAEAPYHWPWLAALAIANRAPWPGCDEWLAGLISRTDAMVHRPAPASESSEAPAAPADSATPSDRATPPEPAVPPRPVQGAPAPGALWIGAYGEATPDIGACAAGMLLVRHQMPPTAFGLDSTAYPPFTTFGFSGYWFRDAAGRDKVITWWQEQRRAAEAQAASHPGIVLGR